VQVDPIKPTLKAPGTKRLKLEYDVLLSNLAFKFILRRYIELLDRSDNVYAPDILGALDDADGDDDEKQTKNFLMQNIYLDPVAGAYTRPLFGST